MVTGAGRPLHILWVRMARLPSKQPDNCNTGKLQLNMPSHRRAGHAAAPMLRMFSATFRWALKTCVEFVFFTTDLCGCV